jgi:3-hydroxyacyl-CoA dehydrogenase
MKTVGIIGNGFVGNAIYQNFKDRISTKVFDVFPKDINALIHTLNENNINSELLQAAWDYNKKIRGIYD